MNPRRAASPQQILEIRTQADAGVLDVRGWATALGCSLETIRRYGRRDTARDLPDVGTSTGLSSTPKRSTRVGVGAEPSEADLMESLARLSAITVAETPKQRVDNMLAELTKKGQEDDQAQT